MKAAVYHGPLDVRVEEVPEPGPLGPDEVLVAPLVGSLCGTDVSEFLAGPKRIPLHHAHSVSGHQGPVVTFTRRFFGEGGAVAQNGPKKM